MLNPLSSAGLFLIETVFDLYILVVTLRILLQWLGAHYRNPVIQVILKLTNPVVLPLRKILPPMRGFDLASLIVLILLEFIKLYLIILLKSGGLANILGVLIIAFADILDMVLDIFFFAIILNAIISWVNPTARTPVTDILYLLTEPLLRPARKLIPPIGGLDISPIPVLILLHLCELIVVNPLISIGINIATGAN